MSDPTQLGYDRIPYRNSCLRPSFPPRIGAIARLLGHAAALPEGARVLELGCAEGLNLLPYAALFPNSHCVGVDLSPVQISVATRVRDAAQLSNAQFVAADLRTWEPEPEAFDYVIAHGVYSWVPDDVKDRLLAVCRTALAPGGFAYVSYNVLPGWGLDIGFRAFLQDEMERAENPQDLWDYLQRVISVLYLSLKDDPAPASRVRADLLAGYLEAGEAMVMHDQLEVHSDPITITRFARHAVRHGLHLVGDAEFATMHINMLSPAWQKNLGVLQPDFLHGQALMDALFPRRHRTSLLCRIADAAPRKADYEAIAACAFRFRIPQPKASATVAGSDPFQIEGRHGPAYPLNTPLARAATLALHAAVPAALSYEELAAATATRLREAGHEGAFDADALKSWLFQGFMLDYFDVLLHGSPEWLTGVASESMQRYEAALHDANLPGILPWHERAD